MLLGYFRSSERSSKQAWQNSGSFTFTTVYPQHGGGNTKHTCRKYLLLSKWRHITLYILCISKQGLLHGLKTDRLRKRKRTIPLSPADKSLFQHNKIDKRIAIFTLGLHLFCFTPCNCWNSSLEVMTSCSIRSTHCLSFSCYVHRTRCYYRL